MDIFYEIFGDLVFQRKELKDGFYIYMALIQSYIGNGQQYVMLLVPYNKAFYEQANILQLDWSCLQTRVIDKNSGLQEQSIDPKKLDVRYAKEKFFLNAIFRDEKSTKYASDRLPIDVSLLHDPKKKSQLQYPDEIELRHALKTFQCVVKLKR